MAEKKATKEETKKTTSKKETSTKKEDISKKTTKKESSTKKEDTKKKTTKKETSTKKESTSKKKTSKADDMIDDVLVSVGKEVAGKLGIDKKLVTKKNVKMVTSLVKDNEAVEGAINTLGGLLGKK